MWQDMGELPNESFELLRARAEFQFLELLQTGDYIGWLVAAPAEPEIIIAGAGVLLRNSLPSPRRMGGNVVGVTTGQLGLLINVFTEPPWRRQGIAMLLLRRIIAWSRKQQLDRLVLHASEAGRPLYEKMGFVGTNEMRLAD